MNEQDDAAWCLDTKLRMGGLCSWEVVPEGAAGQQIDLESFNVRLAGYNGDHPLDYPIERVPDPEGCTDTGLEWYFREGTDPPLLMVCPNACSLIAQGGEGLMWIRARCL